MDEDEIKTLRHSFTSKEDAGKIKKNQFGHTVLGDSHSFDISKTQVEINEQGEIEANSTESILTNPAFLSLINALEKNENTNDQRDQVIDIKPNNVNLADLLSQLDDMDGTTEREKTQSELLKKCANEKCLYAIPKDSTFCLKCGTYQARKFCTECGYKFPGVEKFCPDCGTKR